MAVDLEPRISDQSRSREADRAGARTARSATVKRAARRWAAGIASPLTDVRIARLRQFGFSEYAARAYLALVDIGTAEARDITAHSKVPSSKIYHILDQLHAKGVVALVPGFPKRYAPVPFSEFLTRMQAFHEEAAQSIVAEREELTRLFSPAKKAKPQPKATFSSVSGRGVLVAKWNEIVRRTERDLLVLATGPFAREVLGGDRLLAEAKSRGIRVRMLLPSTARVPPSGIEVARVEGHEGLSIVSADSEYVLLVSSSVTSGAEQEGEAESWGGIEAHGASAATLARLLENEWLLHGRGGIIESDQRLRHLRIEGRDETKGPELDRSP